MTMLTLTIPPAPIKLSTAPVDYQPALRRLMQRVQRALHTKTGAPQPALARTVYGICIAFVKVQPQRCAELTDAIDQLPRGLPTGQYECRIRALLHELTSDSHRAETARRMGRNSQPAAIAAVLEEAW